MAGLRPAALAVALCAGGLLLASHAQAYELKRTVNGETVRWHEGPVPMRVGRRAACGPSRAELRAAMEMAVEAWRVDPTVPDVVVATGRPPADHGYQPPYEGGNGVYVLCDWPFEPHLAVTITTHDPEGRIRDADILVNGNRRYAMLDEGAESNAYDLASIMTHEVGHVLGLGESDRRNATMWPRTARGDLRQRTLARDDERAVIAAYEGGAPLAPMHSCGVAPTSQNAQTAPWLIATLMLAATLTRRRVR